MLHAIHNDPIKIGRWTNSTTHQSRYYLVLLEWESMAARPPFESSSSFSTDAWVGKRPWRRAPLLRLLHLSAQVLERESVHGGAPPSGKHPSSCSLLPPGSARRVESTSDSDPKWSPYLLVPRRKPWKTQSGLPNPSLWKRARAPPVRSPLAFSRSTLDTLLSGFLLLYLILDVTHPRSNPSLDLLA